VLVSDTRAALYVDFDNFFGGLIATDPTSAVEVAMNPARWLSRLTYAHPADGERRWLAVRCYMNPSGWVANPLAEGERLYFSKFRPYFVQAGFEVVDCPTLARGKNAADIRIVIDVMTALQGPSHVDEFVLASSDADFTPLLQVVRAHDRRIMMIATGETATAYEALADRLLDAQSMLELVRVDEPEEEADQAAPAGLAESHDDGGDGRSELFKAFRTEMTNAYLEASEPINLARAASQVVAQLGTELRTTNWLGAGSFGRAVRVLDLPNAAFSQLFLWDTSRHAPPEQAGTDRQQPSVAALFEVARLPRIAREDWPRVSGYLEAYAASNDFNLTEASKWPRDRAAEDGHQIPRAAFLYVITACHHQGTRLDGTTKPTADAIARALVSSVLSRAELAGITVATDDAAAVAEWLGV
jgi:hypothetical protein